MRLRFNASEYARRANDATDPSVSVREIVDRGPAPAWAPAGARSQIIAYSDAYGATIAIAHQYGLPDGTPIKSRGRRTRPDPKFIFEDGVRYKYDPKLDAR